MARVPQLEGVAARDNCTSMTILWLLSISLPPVFTRGQDGQGKSSQATGGLEHKTGVGRESASTADGAIGGVTKDPMWTSMLLLRKMVSH